MRTGLEVPSGDVSVTASCVACAGPLPSGRTRQYCSPACRQDAYRRRHQPARPSANLPARRSRRDGTVYACGECESRYLGEQWCPDCNRPCQRLGAGGTCPSCEEVILSEELTGDQVDDTPSKNLSLQDSPSTMKKSPRFQGKLKWLLPRDMSVGAAQRVLLVAPGWLEQRRFLRSRCVTVQRHRTTPGPGAATPRPAAAGVTSGAPPQRPRS
jgi:hypothetical protein